MSVADYLVFVREAFRRHETTGAVWPSSSSLARAITRFVARKTGPARILEVGPGTGVFTRQILRHLTEHDELTLVEVNPTFAALLEKRVAKAPQCAPHQSRIRIICSPIETAPLAGKYDFIVSGLPLNNFEPPHVRTILRRLRQLAAPGCVLSFFEYLGLRRIRTVAGRAATRRRLRTIEATIRAFERRHGFARDIVWANVPPALVRHWRF